MSRFPGHMRENDDRPVAGIIWARDPGCVGRPTPGTVSGTPSTEAVQESTGANRPSSQQPWRNGSRRIDMAATISVNKGNKTAFRKGREEDLEDTQIVDIQEWSEDGDDIKTENSDDDKIVVCGTLFCTPYECRAWYVGIFLLALFLVGLGVGLTVRQSSSKSQDFAAMVEQGGGDATNDGQFNPTLAPQESSSPSSYPTTYFDFDFDADEYMDEIAESVAADELAESVAADETTETADISDSVGTGESATAVAEDFTESVGTEEIAETIQWDNSASPYLVGAYYYPWHGTFQRRR
jgi:hypothetical protein